MLYGEITHIYFHIVSNNQQWITLTYYGRHNIIIDIGNLPKTSGASLTADPSNNVMDIIYTIGIETEPFSTTRRRSPLENTVR